MRIKIPNIICGVVTSGGLIICSAMLYAAELTTVDNALREIYPQAKNFSRQEKVLTIDEQLLLEEKAGVSFELEHSSEVIYYIALDGEKNTGYAYEDTVIGKWGPIHYLVGVSKEGDISQVIILDYQEIRGKPIAKKRFLRQYQRKNVQDPVQLHKDIDGVSGATIASRALTDGIRKILHIHQIVTGPA